MRLLSGGEARDDVAYSDEPLHDPTFFVRESDVEAKYVGLDKSGLGPGITCAIVFRDGSSIALASGIAYFFEPGIDSPANQLAPEPIQEILVLPDNSGAVMADYLTVSYVNEHGLAWTSDRVSYDGIKKLRVADGRVIAEGYNAPVETEEASIVIELDSGRIVQSAYP